MPTTRARHLITETDEVAQALDAAAIRWPDSRGSRSRLILRLIAAGHHALQSEDAQRRATRLDAVHKTGGSLTGVYGPHYLDQLRADWPE